GGEMAGGQKLPHPGNPRRKERLLRLSLVAREGHPASSRLVRATPAQERERRARAAAVEKARELNRVIDGNLAKLRVRYRSRPARDNYRGLEDFGYFLRSVSRR